MATTSAPKGTSQQAVDAATAAASVAPGDRQQIADQNQRQVAALMGANPADPMGFVAPALEGLPDELGLGNVRRAVLAYRAGYDKTDPAKNIELLQAIDAACAPVARGSYKIYVEELMGDVAKRLVVERRALVAKAPPQPEVPQAIPDAPPEAPPAPLDLAPKPPPKPVAKPKAAPPKGGKAEAAPEFGKEFASTSIGIESELGGFTCALPQNANRVFGYIRLKGGADPLVQITKDMSTGKYGNPKHRDFVKDADQWKVHTLELVTYPSALADATAIGHRNSSVKFLLATLLERLGSHNHEPLETMTSPDGLYELVVTNRNHVIAAGNGVMVDDAPAVSMPLGGQQATMGVVAKDFGTGANEQLKMLEAAPWYHADFKAEVTAETAKAKAPGDAQGVYAYLKSILAFASSLVEKYNLPIEDYAPSGAPKAQGLTDPAVKNEWKILPRTKPLLLLDTLEGPDKLLVKQLLTRTTGGASWAAVRTYLLGGGEVAGHGINDATIGGKQAMLFEFRSIPDGLKDIVPKTEAPPVETLDDPLSTIDSKNKTSVINGLRAYAQTNADAFKVWFLANNNNKYADKPGATIANLAAANQIARYMKTTDAAKWNELTKATT
jgi:hypothetical protein